MGNLFNQFISSTITDHLIHQPTHFLPCPNGGHCFMGWGILGKLNKYFLHKRLIFQLSAHHNRFLSTLRIASMKANRLSGPQIRHFRRIKIGDIQIAPINFNMR
ncbi:hypothetical protein BGP_6257 [Beggiatoa sp. PS]|nr:hypothetical protein BGP_6257 [Beggiatoa sp. PS]